LGAQIWVTKGVIRKSFQRTRSQTEMELVYESCRGQNKKGTDCHETEEDESEANRKKIKKQKDLERGWSCQGAPWNHSTPSEKGITGDESGVEGSRHDLFMDSPTINGGEGKGPSFSASNLKHPEGKITKRERGGNHSLTFGQKRNYARLTSQRQCHPGWGRKGQLRENILI